MIAYLPTHWPGPRNLSPVLIDGGWGAWIDQYAETAVERGFNRLFVHLPFGETPGTHYRLDAYVECLRDPATRHVAEGFRPAWGPFRRRHPDIRIIFYVGPANGSPKLKDLASDPADADVWADLVHQSIDPIVDIQADICLDAQVWNRPDTQAARSYDLIRSIIKGYDGKLGVEGWPRYDRDPRYKDADFQANATPPDANDPALVPESDITGEIIVLDALSRWTLEQARGYLLQGYTVGINPHAGEFRKLTAGEVAGA